MNDNLDTFVYEEIYGYRAIKKGILLHKLRTHKLMNPRWYGSGIYYDITTDEWKLPTNLKEYNDMRQKDKQQRLDDDGNDNKKQEPQLTPAEQTQVEQDEYKMVMGELGYILPQTKFNTITELVNDLNSVWKEEEAAQAVFLNNDDVDGANQFPDSGIDEIEEEDGKLELTVDDYSNVQEEEGLPRSKSPQDRLSTLIKLRDAYPQEPSTRSLNSTLLNNYPSSSDDNTNKLTRYDMRDYITDEGYLDWGRLRSLRDDNHNMYSALQNDCIDKILLLEEKSKIRSFTDGRHREWHHAAMRSLGGNNNDDQLAGLLILEHMSYHQYYALCFYNWEVQLAASFMLHRGAATLTDSELEDLISGENNLLQTIVMNREKTREFMSSVIKDAELDYSNIEALTDAGVFDIATIRGFDEEQQKFILQFVNMQKQGRVYNRHMVETHTKFLNGELSKIESREDLKHINSMISFYKNYEKMVLANRNRRYKQWMKVYNTQILPYFNKHGHLASHPNKGWVTYQRNKYKEGTMDAEKVRLLTEVGIVFNPNQFRFDLNILAVKEYKLISGMKSVPNTAVHKGVKVGQFVARLRSIGIAKHLVTSTEQQSILDSVLSINLHRGKWDTKARSLFEFLEKNPGYKCLGRGNGETEKLLSIWLEKQRTTAQKNRNNKEQNAFIQYVRRRRYENNKLVTTVTTEAENIDHIKKLSILLEDILNAESTSCAKRKRKSQPQSSLESESENEK